MIRISCQIRAATLKHCLKLEVEHDRKASDAEGMRIYDLNHSHVSLLIEGSIVYVYVDGCSAQ